MRPHRARTQGHFDRAAQIQPRSRMYVDPRGADSWRTNAHGGDRRSAPQSFNPDRYQLVQPSWPGQGLVHRPSNHGNRAGGGEHHRAAQLIQARQRGINARRRFTDYLDCKAGAIRIQVSLGLKEHRCCGHLIPSVLLQHALILLVAACCPAWLDSGSIPWDGRAQAAGDHCTTVV